MNQWTMHYTDREKHGPLTPMLWGPYTGRGAPSPCKCQSCVVCTCDPVAGKLMHYACCEHAGNGVVHVLKTSKQILQRLWLLDTNDLKARAEWVLFQVFSILNCLLRTTVTFCYQTLSEIDQYIPYIYIYQTQTIRPVRVLYNQGVYLIHSAQSNAHLLIPDCLESLDGTRNFNYIYTVHFPCWLCHLGLESTSLISHTI